MDADAACRPFCTMMDGFGERARSGTGVDATGSGGRLRQSSARSEELGVWAELSTGRLRESDRSSGARGADSGRVGGAHAQSLRDQGAAGVA